MAEERVEGLAAGGGDRRREIGRAELAAQVRDGDRARLVLDGARGAVLDLAVHEPRDREAGAEQTEPVYSAKRASAGAGPARPREAHIAIMLAVG